MKDINGNKATEMADIETDGLNQTSSKDVENNRISGDESTNTNEDSNVNDGEGVNNVKAEDVSVEQTSNGDETEPKTRAPPQLPKYHYGIGQWSPMNQEGKKQYDLNFLKQLKDDPMSKKKPENAPVLESFHKVFVIRSEPAPFSLNNVLRPVNDSLFPSFLKNTLNSRSTLPRDNKGGLRHSASVGKTPNKPPQSPNNAQKLVIHVSLRDESNIRLNKSENAWKPARLKKENLSEEELKTEELYKQFRGILNKLTPQKFDTLVEKVKSLEIKTQKHLEGVIDLLFLKAIKEPKFSEAYAAMCSKLVMVKVPAENATNPNQVVNFRALIINRCQKQFETQNADQEIIELEKEVAECTDPVKRKELQHQLEEEQRKVRMRQVGNIRFIGELFKLRMLTAKIMVYCMDNLLKELEEERLECLCKLLSTIGQQVEQESPDQVNRVFNSLQTIVDKKAHKISNRVKFMIQDVIELRRRKWVAKSVVDSKPKLMDQIQKEADEQQKIIEIMNATPSGDGYARGGGKRGDNRRPPPKPANWANKQRTNYVVDTSKLKAVTQKSNISSVKLGPPQAMWTQGSGARAAPSAPAPPPQITLSRNMYSILEQTDTPNIVNKENTPIPKYQPKGASIERSMFDSKTNFMPMSANRAGSMNSLPMTIASEDKPTTESRDPGTKPATVTTKEQVPMPEATRKYVASMVDQWIINSGNDDLSYDIKKVMIEYHADMMAEMINIAFNKPVNELRIVCRCVTRAVAGGDVAPAHFLRALADTLAIAPDLYIDLPNLYDLLANMLAPLLEKKLVTLNQILELSGETISNKQGHLLLGALLRELLASMGPSFVKTKWQDSGLQLAQWMGEDQIESWLRSNKLEFLMGDVAPCAAGGAGAEGGPITCADATAKLLQLMDSDESVDCINGWIQDNVDGASRASWLPRALVQALCEHAAAHSSRASAALSAERMDKFARLLTEHVSGARDRELECLYAIQQLIHRLEFPKGLALDIFQYLHEQYIIPVESFIAWEESELHPEGKGVMLKALTSFFTNIKEADNEESGSDD